MSKIGKGWSYFWVCKELSASYKIHDSVYIAFFYQSLLQTKYHKRWIKISIDYLFAHFEAQKPKRVHYKGSGDHYTKPSKKYLVSSFCLLHSTMPWSFELGLSQGVSLDYSLYVVNGINESPKTKSCEPSCQQRSPKVHVALMREVFDQCVINPKIAA